MYTVVGKPNCPWCDKAKALLDDEGLSYNYIEVGPSDTDPLRLFIRWTFRTVPQIWDNANHHIGGYEDLREYLALTD